MQWPDHYILLSTIFLSVPHWLRPSSQINCSKSPAASSSLLMCCKCHLLLLLLPSSLCAFIPLHHCNHLSVLPLLHCSSPLSLHPSHSMTALSLDASSSRKAVTMMDCQLTHSSPSRLSLYPCSKSAALCVACVLGHRCHCPGHGRKGQARRVRLAAPVSPLINSELLKHDPAHLWPQVRPGSKPLATATQNTHALLCDYCRDSNLIGCNF